MSAFVDSRNTGYYANAYTTKLNPGMDVVLHKLLDGVRRVHDEWEAAEPRKRAAGDAAATEEPSGNGLTDAASDAWREQFSRTMQMLMQFETSFRRASWKSGCGMVFPILFRRFVFSKHRFLDSLHAQGHSSGGGGVAPALWADRD